MRAVFNQIYLHLISRANRLGKVIEKYFMQCLFYSTFPFLLYPSDSSLLPNFPSSSSSFRIRLLISFICFHVSNPNPNVPFSNVQTSNSLTYFRTGLQFCSSLTRTQMYSPSFFQSDSQRMSEFKRMKWGAY